MWPFYNQIIRRDEPWHFSLQSFQFSAFHESLRLNRPRHRYESSSSIFPLCSKGRKSPIGYIIIFYHYCISLGSVLFVFSIVRGADDRSFWYESGKEADGLLYLLSFICVTFRIALLVRISDERRFIVRLRFGILDLGLCDLFVDWIFGTLMWVLMKI